MISSGGGFLRRRKKKKKRVILNDVDGDEECKTDLKFLVIIITIGVVVIIMI